MKKYFLVFVITLMSCNFYGNKNVIDVKNVASTNPKIIGTWYSDTDRTTKWVFKDDLKVYCYEEGVLSVIYSYSVSHDCEGNSDIKFEFLKLVNEDGVTFCYEINGINENNSGILSLTYMNNMQVSLFVNNPNIKIGD